MTKRRFVDGDVFRAGLAVAIAGTVNTVLMWSVFGGHVWTVSAALTVAVTVMAFSVRPV